MWTLLQVYHLIGQKFLMKLRFALQIKDTAAHKSGCVHNSESYRTENGEGTSNSWNWCPLNLCPFLKKNLKKKTYPGKILVSITFHFLLPGSQPDVLQYSKVCSIGIFGCINFRNYWKFYVRRFTGDYLPNSLRLQGFWQSCRRDSTQWEWPNSVYSLLDMFIFIMNTYAHIT